MRRSSLTGIVVIVDAQVDEVVVVCPRNRPGRNDGNRGGLSSAPVSAGGIPGREGDQEPVGESAAASLVRLRHRIDNVRSG